MRAVLFATWVAALAGTTCLTNEASACTGRLGCNDFAPEHAASLPASIPGLPFRGDAQVSLRDARGKLVAGRTDGHGYSSAFVPLAPLEPGIYEASWSSGCSAPEERSTTLTITEAVPMPSQTGTLRVREAAHRRLALAGDYARTSCVDAAFGAVVTLAVVPDEALVPYVPIVVLETVIDGSGPSTILPVQADHAPRRDGLDGQLADGPLTVRLFANCEADDGGLSRLEGVAPGTHDVEVRARLVGGPDIAPARIRVRLSCGEKNGEVLEAIGPLEIEKEERASEKVGATPRGCAMAWGRRAEGSGIGAVALLVGVLARRRRVRSFERAPDRP